MPQNAINLKVVNLADGYSIQGGTTPRKLTLASGDVSIVGGGAAVITFPASTGTLYATNNTDVALTDGGTGASLSDPNADRIMFWDDSAGQVTWLTAGTGLSIVGTTMTATASAVVFQAYDYFVYRSGGDTVAYKTSDGTTFSTDTDASVVMQACVNAIDATAGTGGGIFVMPGTYACASAITCQGDQTTDSQAVRIHCAGIQTTTFVGASNVNVFVFSERAKFSLKDARITVKGSGSAVKITNSSVGQRGAWLSEIKNLYIYGDDITVHTGVGMTLENPFRMVIENIDMNQVNNGLQLKAIDSATNYNPGDLTVSRIFVELRSVAGGYAYNINSNAASNSRMNQMVFTMCEGYGGGTAQTGILIDGTKGCNHTNWIGINLENFDIILDIQAGRNNYFDFNYLITRDVAATTYFKMSSTSYNNRVGCKYTDTNTQAITLINDANTLALQPNVFENIMLQGSATAVTITTTQASIVKDIKDNISGTDTYSTLHRAWRTSTTTSSATVTPNAGTDDVYTVTAQAAAITFAAPVGRAQNGQRLLIRLKDNGTARGITWNAIYRASSDLALPTTTVLSKTLYCGFVYNSTDTKWDLLATLGNFT